MGLEAFDLPSQKKDQFRPLSKTVHGCLKKLFVLMVYKEVTIDICLIGQGLLLTKIGFETLPPNQQSFSLLKLKLKFLNLNTKS